jgi:hypothetical protein
MSYQGDVIFNVRVWHALALHPAAAVPIIGASPFAFRSRTDADVQLTVAPPEARYQKLPFEALQDE